MRWGKCLFNYRKHRIPGAGPRYTKDRKRKKTITPARWLNQNTVKRKRKRVISDKGAKRVENEENMKKDRGKI